MHKVICAMAMACFGLPAAAATLSISGEISAITPELDVISGITVGTEFSITIEVDETSDVIGTEIIPGGVISVYGLDSYSVTIGSVFSDTFNLNEDGAVAVTANDVTDIVLNGDVIGASALPVEFIDAFGTFDVFAVDPTGSMFEADSSLLEALQGLANSNLSDLEVLFVYDQFDGTSPLGTCPSTFVECAIFGTVTSAAVVFDPTVGVAPVPLPASSVLLLAGLGGLAALRKRR